MSEQRDQTNTAGGLSEFTDGLEHGGWQCDLGNGEFDHDWKWIGDWYGDPGVIGGTADCSYWICRACGEEDHESPPPSYDDDVF